MKEKKQFNLLAVSLVKFRSPRSCDTCLISIRDKLNNFIKINELFIGLEFIKVVLSIRYGLKNDEKPSYQRVNKKYGDLPVYIEIDVNKLLEVKGDEKELYKLLYKPCLVTLIDLAKKHKLDGSYFEEELEKLNNGQLVIEDFG